MDLKISKNKISGSYIISLESLESLKKYIRDYKESSDLTRFVDQTNKFGRALIKEHPTMVSVRKKISLVIYYLKRLVKTNKKLHDIKILCIDKINELNEIAAKKQKNIGNLGSKLVFNHNKIITISASTSVKEILLSAHKLKRKFQVYCLESRPLLEGTLFAEELASKGIQTHLITDASMAQNMPNINLVFCGADRLYESGFINKIGTFPLAMVAKIFRVPFYLACETDKILKEIDRSIRFYPNDSKEVHNPNSKNLNVLNYYFESIPLEYVSKIICEEGVFETNEFSNWYLED